ncbi:MAG: RidA family protein [Chloroflexi bacterium]|nr:MAG: RidA family protein [Chloroflexota bacterium]
MKKLINPDSLAPPRGFNHGILVSGGQLLFLAGQTASDADGNIIAPGDLVAQYEQVLRNHQMVVEAAGGSMTDIVKLNIFVRDKDDYLSKLKAIGEVHRRYFGHYYPTMALFEITGLFQEEALIEMEGMAVIGVED